MVCASVQTFRTSIAQARNVTCYIEFSLMTHGHSLFTLHCQLDHFVCSWSLQLVSAGAKKYGLGMCPTSPTKIICQVVFRDLYSCTLEIFMVVQYIMRRVIIHFLKLEICLQLFSKHLNYAEKGAWQNVCTWHTVMKMCCIFKDIKAAICPFTVCQDKQ